LFIPLRAERLYRRRVFITYILLVVNVAIHFVVAATGYEAVILRSAEGEPIARVRVNSLHYQGGLLLPRDSLLSPRVISSMFLHGDWAHLIFNMLFLFVFGCAVEDLVGWLRFLVIYFLSGWFGDVAFALSYTNEFALLIGASGAISGIMGAHLVLLPRNRVTVLWMFGYPLYVRLLTVSAWLVIGMWVVLQLLMAFLAGPGGGGVAYAAHLGGIGAGAAIALLIRRFFPFEHRPEPQPLPFYGNPY